MRIPINLASEPFRRDRPALVACAAGCTVLTVLLAILIVCGLVTLWVHRNLEDDGNGEADTSTASFHSPAR